jgi:hypothetical protein
LTCFVEDEFGLPVDIVPLRRAPPRMRLKALLNGVVLVVRDNNLYWLLVSQALAEATDMETKPGENSRLRRGPNST